MNRHLPVAQFVTALLALCSATARGQSSETEPVVVLSEYEITGTRPALIDAVALKAPLRVLETPRSITILDASRAVEQDFQNGSDLVNWVPGVFSNGDSHHFYARGFRMSPNDWRVDGFAGYTGAYSTRLFGVESVTVLKGPAGLLYGAASQPGGLLNITTKRPAAVAATTAAVRMRTFSGGGVSFGERVGGEFEFDSTGPVSASGRLLYRVLAAEDRNALPAEGVTDKNAAYRVAFTALLDSEGRFRVTPLFEWYREAAPARTTTISPGSSRTTSDGRTDYILSDLGPRTVNTSAGRRIDGGYTAGVEASARITERWKASIAANQHTRDFESNQWTAQTSTLRQSDAADPRSWVVSRRQARSKSDALYDNLDFATSFEMPSGTGFAATLQAGLNGRLSEVQAYSFATSTLNQSPINIYTGTVTSPLVDVVPNTPVRGDLTDTDQWTAYIQYRMRLMEKFHVGLAGGRAWQNTTTTSDSGVRTRAPDRSSDLTPNVSLVYLPTDKVSFYASFSTSYSLVDPLAEDIRGRTGTFDPTEGVNYEIGTKAELWGDLLAATISAFDTRLDGVLVQSEVNQLNPNGRRYYTQLDSGRRSKGVEVDFTVAPARNWSSTIGLAYVDAYNRTATGARGPRAEMTPKYSANAFTRYTFATGPLRGVRGYLGVIWQDERIGGSAAPSARAPDPLWLRPFTRVDMGASYTWREWAVSVNVENLLDRTYLVGGSTGLGLVLGNPRTLGLRLARTW